MLQTIIKYRFKKTPSTLVRILIFCFLTSSGVPVSTSWAQTKSSQSNVPEYLPAAGTRLTGSVSFHPPTLAGLHIDPQNPWQMEFYIDTGDDHEAGDRLNQTNQRLINYFLTALTVPDDQLWVNLSPEEANRIIAPDLVKTEMGRDMLAQDYLLKQLMASLLYPEEGIGKEFWQRVHRRAQAQFGTTDIPTDTFNKIWIVPKQAHVHVQGGSVFIVDSDLDVMLEEDYLTLAAHTGEHPPARDDWSEQTKQLIREVVIPEIVREVNTGKHFATLRQIYHAMLLATWYKKNLRENVLGQIYVDRNLVTGIDLAAPDTKERIYQQYLEAFRKGAFDYIREDVDPLNGTAIPRRYFSGGLQGYDQAMVSSVELGPEFFDGLNKRPLIQQTVVLKPYESSAADPLNDNDRLIAVLPNPDPDLFKRLEFAHFDYNVYGTTRKGVKYVGGGYSRRAYAIPKEFPNLVFKVARVDQQADPPSKFESANLSALAQKLGYETVVVDGIELIQVPGLAPFRYYKNTIIQKRGVPTTEVDHFTELVALFAKLGVRWDLAAVRFPETQLKNIALFPEIVDGEEKLVPRVIDLKDFNPPPGADQAITAEDHLRLHALFENLPREIAFLWKQADRISTEVTKLGQAAKSAPRDAELLVKLRNLLRILMSIRELPIFVDAQPQFGYPHIDTTPNGIFYGTVDELVGDIETHVVHLQKYLAPAKFGAPPYGMSPINESVLLLKEQFRRADRSIRALQKATRYPVLARPSGYYVFVDMLNRNMKNEAFQEGFLGKMGALGLNRDITPLSNTGLRKIQTSLTRLLRNVRQVDRVSADNQLRLKETIARLKTQLRWEVEQVIHTNDLRQFPIQDTNNYFIQSVVASTTREMLLDVFGRLLEAGIDGVDGNNTEERIIHLIEGVDLIQRQLEELSRRSDYIFVLDEETSLIVAKLDIPIKAVDLAMTASLDDSLRGRFRRFALHAVLPLLHLEQNVSRLRNTISGRQAVLTDTERAQIVGILDDVEQNLVTLRTSPYYSGVDKTQNDAEGQAIFKNTLRALGEQLGLETEQTRGIIEDKGAANSHRHKKVIARFASQLEGLVKTMRALGQLDHFPLLRSDNTTTVFFEAEDINTFQHQLRNAFEQKMDSYGSAVRLVGSETDELFKLEEFVAELEKIHRNFVFPGADSPQRLTWLFMEQRERIREQIDQWAETLERESGDQSGNETARVQRIVHNTLMSLVQTRLKPIILSEVDVTSIESRSRYVNRLTLELDVLKDRLRVLGGVDNFLLVRDQGGLRVGINPQDMVDSSMALRFHFKQFLMQSGDAFKALHGRLEALQKIVQNTNLWLTQEQVIELIEQILYNLAEIRSVPAIQLAALETSADGPNVNPLRIVQNTVAQAMTQLEHEAAVIGLLVREPADTTVASRVLALIQTARYYQRLFELLANSEQVPVVDTSAGPIVFHEAVTYDLSPEDLRRAFQRESLRLGTNMVTVGAADATPFARLQAFVRRLEDGLDAWDPQNPLAYFKFGATLGDVRSQMLEILDDIAKQNQASQPSTIESREDLVGALVFNSLDQIVVDRLRGWIEGDAIGYILKEDAQDYVRSLRQELRLAAQRINGLARRPNFAFKMHDVSGDFSLDLTALEPVTDQATLGDRLLSLHFQTVEYLDGESTVTFSDDEVDLLIYWLDGYGTDLLPSANLFKKLMNQIYVVYRKEQGVNGLTRQWLKLLSEKWDVSMKKPKNILRWFKFVDLDTATISPMALSEFFETYLKTVRKYPEVYDSFTYYVPPGATSEEKLSLAASNMQTLTTMFSDDFIRGKTRLKALIPGRDYYVGLEFGVPENGFGLNVVLGTDAEDPNQPFPNVFMRIGIDTQGPDLRVNFMQGVAGQEALINNDFITKMGFHPGIALLYIALDLAHQGHVEFTTNGLNPKVDPFRVLHGIRPEFIPSLSNRLSKASINIMKGYDDFGLRKKSEFTRWRSVNDLVRLLIPQRIAQRDLRARSITRLHEAFRNFKEVPTGDQAQLSETQRIAVLELVAEQVGVHGDDYLLSLNYVLETLDIPYDLGTEVYQLIMDNARTGLFSGKGLSMPTERDEAQLNNDTKGGIDLDPANLNLRQTGDPWLPNENGAVVPVLQPIQGLVPVLINVTPVTNLPLLLGLTAPTSKHTAHSEQLPVPPPPAPSTEHLSLLR